MRQACLRVATDAAKRGATIMLEKLGADVVKTKANARDLLTEVDPEVQRIIEGSVSEAFPTHRFLGEESVPPGAEASDAALAELLDDGGDEEGSEGGSDWLWVVDPIDGTTNFCHSMPLSAISIGVAYRGELQVAVIMDPFAGEIFSASKGCGAYCNFAQMRVGEEATGEESVVVTGYGATAESADAMIKGMKALTALPVRSIRMLGSAAIMLAWVAAGRLTAYYECDLNSWDTAAGALLVREAGGEMTDLVTGEAYSLRTRAILASNGKTHEEIRTCLIEGGVRALKDYEESKEYEESRG
jgi:myo-inositol-1(or 4)-monophosphatase